jgi:hypothetical protein
MSDKKCFYHEEGCLKKAEYKVSFLRSGFPPFKEREETYLTCSKHRKKVVYNMRNLYRSLNIETGTPKIKRVSS